MTVHTNPSKTEATVVPPPDWRASCLPSRNRREAKS